MEYYLIVTNRCNLACDYCFERKDEWLRTQKKGGPTEPTYSIDALMAHFKGDQSRSGLCAKCGPAEGHDQIVFYGGEPLLNQPFIKKVIEAVKSEDSLKHFKFMLQTNGTLLKTIDPYVLKNLGIISVSIDGTKEIHDKHRKFPDGRGSYDIIMENMKWLQTQKCVGSVEGGLVIDMKKLRETVGPEGNIKATLKEIVDYNKPRKET